MKLFSVFANIPLSKYGGDMINNDKNLQNPDCPFTELFSKMVCYKDMPPGVPSSMLVYSTTDMITMIKHIENAIEALLRGMQDLSPMIGKNKFESCNASGFFFSMQCNLIEALNSLQSELLHGLNKRGVITYS
jgi:hypothetical protein